MNNKVLGVKSSSGVENNPQSCVPMTVRQFLNVFSHGSVVFRLCLDDGSYPEVCRSDVSNGKYHDISRLHTFNLLDCRVCDIIQNFNEFHVFIDE